MLCCLQVCADSVPIPVLAFLSLSRGSRCYFPVFLEGGNLSLGDLHFRSVPSGDTSLGRAADAIFALHSLPPSFPQSG